MWWTEDILDLREVEERLASWFSESPGVPRMAVCLALGEAQGDSWPRAKGTCSEPSSSHRTSIRAQSKGRKLQEDLMHHGTVWLPVALHHTRDLHLVQ